MIILLPVLVALVGLLLYGFAANPKLQHIGELSFFAGLLAFLVKATPETLKLL